MRHFLVSSLAVLMLTAGASAAYAEDTDKSDKDNPKQWVCKNEKMTGSLTRTRRICLKREEWTKLAQGTGEGVSKFVSESQHMGRQPRDSQLAGGW